MTDSLKTKTISTLFWSLIERGGQQGIQVVISIVLSRLFVDQVMPEIAHRRAKWEMTLESSGGDYSFWKESRLF